MDIPRPSKWKRIRRKLALGTLAALLLILAAGFVSQHRRDAAFRAAHPPPGSLVEIDGHRLHYRLRGAGDFTFVLEAGLGDYSGSWGALESSLAGIGRVFVYDRAGLGWSDVTSTPRTAQQIARELHDLLAKARIPKPYILVGHSLGGISQMRFAMDYPDGVAGLLLIDPSHKDQFKRLPAPPAMFTWLLPQFTRLAPFGLPQLLFGSADPVQNLSTHVQTSGAELRAFLKIDETWGDQPLRAGPLPLYVLTAGDPAGLPGKSDAEKRAAGETWRSLQAELVAGSSSPIRRQVVVEGSSHYIHRVNPSIVTGAARELVERIKARQP